MRILISAGIFPPDIGGPATYADKLSKELALRGHEVAVLSYADGKFQISDLRFKISPAGFGKMKNEFSKI